MVGVRPLPAEPLVRAAVHEKLRGRFVTGKFVPGGTLSTRAIASELGVSQMPVREAFGRLAAEGAVEIRSKRRIVVPMMSVDRFRDVLRCRELLEPEAAVLALPHISPARFKKIRQADDALGKALDSGDVDRYMECNFDFHFLIYRAQPSPTMTRLIETLWLQFGPHMRVVYERVGTAKLADQHQIAIRAIRAGNAAKLRRAILTDIRDGMGLLDRRGLAEGK
jgi:DNA-binding GntR family transcriptional regulator